MLWQAMASNIEVTATSNFPPSLKEPFLHPSSSLPTGDYPCHEIKEGRIVHLPLSVRPIDQNANIAGKELSRMLLTSNG